MIASIWRRAATPIDIASLAAFRIVFGAVMFVGLCRFLASGWIEQIYGAPRFFFTYPGFAWVRPGPVWAMYAHYGVLAALALAIASGLFYRVSLALFVVGFAYTQLIDVTNYLNHHYLVVLLGALLWWLPADAAWSIDAWRKPTRARATVPRWCVWLLRFQVGVVYVFAGLAKAKSDWLFHAQPLGLWLPARAETPLVGPLLDEPWFAFAMSWGGFLFDTTIVAWLSWRRTRLAGYGALIVFHGATGYLFNIGMFPLIMTSAALIFFDPSWPRRLLRRPVPAIADDGAARPVARAGRWLLAGYVIVQVALPARQLVYPGDVLWNEDGMRFAWHVMIREKQGSVTFVARFSDGRRLEISARHYLTWRQEREMSSQPDLILQLARHIAKDLRRQGLRDFGLHAEALVSLNGRPPAPMIDPAVDLLQVRDLGPRDWVLPAPATVPPRLKPLR